MWILLTSLLASAGGGGAYLETTPGAAWTDATGPITRGTSGGLSLGAFWGPYKATIQYGRYSRAGLNVNASSAKPFREGPELVIASIGPELGGGIDLLKAGAYWRVVVSPAVYVAGADLDGESDDFPLEFGLSVRVAGGGIWWVTRGLGVVGRLEAGPNYRLDDRTTFTGGIGIGLIARVGAVTRRALPDEEAFDPEALPWEEEAPDEPPAEEAGQQDTDDEASEGA